MEGAGEGMVAVLEGTKNAGLKVTMLPNRLLRRKCVLLDLGINPTTRLTQSSVDTGTENVLKNASSPLCDVKYSSSYQFSNCIRNSHQSSFGSKYHRHGGFTRHSSLFEDSLRKYPDGTASSEILQRIINYTNTEQTNRRSNLRSIRSMLRKSTSYNNHVKCDTGVNASLYIKKPLRPSISTIGSKYSSQKELHNYTYDYLKSSPHLPKCSDIRYLTEIKKCIRDRLLELIDNKPVMCPKIRSRYSHHRRKYHKNTSKQNLPVNGNEAIDSRGNDDNKGNSYQMESSFSRHKPCFFHQPRKCVCKTKSNNLKPLQSLMTKLYPDLIVDKEDKTPVDGETLKNQDEDNIMSVVSEWLEKIPVFANFSASDRKKQEELARKLAKNLSKLKNQKDFIPKAKLQIMEYLNSSPIWQPTDLSAKNRFFEMLVSDLIKRLNNMFGQEVEQNIAQILSRLPFKEGVDIKQIQDEFISKVKPTILQIPKGDSKFKEIIKPKVLNIIRKLPLLSTVENLHDLTDEIVDQLSQFHESVQEDETDNKDDKIKENVMNFCENVPELANIDFSDEPYLIDELVNKFKEYENENLNDEDVKEKLMSEVQNWLNDVAQTKNIRLNSDTKNQLNIKMLEHVLGTDNNEYESKSPDFASTQVFLEPLEKWFHNIPQFRGENLAENRKDLAKLAKDLKEIHSRKLSHESTNTHMKNLIYDWLQNKFSQKGIHVETKDLDNHVNNILSDLTEFKRSQNTEEEEDSHLDHDKDIMKLINKFNNIRRSLDSTTQINDAVSEFIQSLSENVGVDVSEKDVKALKDKLFARWRQTSKKRKRWDKLKESYPTIQSKIKDVLKEYPNSLGNSNFDKIGDKIFDAITKNIEENSLLDLGELNSEIKNVLEQETELKKSDQDDLANRIFTKLQRVLPQEVIRRSREFASDMETSAENSLEPKKKLKKQKSPRTLSIEDGDEKYKMQYGRKMEFQAGDVQKRPKHSKTLSTIYQSSHSDLNVQNSINYSGTSYKNRGDKSKPVAFNKNKNIRTSTPISNKEKKKTVDVASDTSRETFRESSRKKTLGRELSDATKYYNKIKNIATDFLKNNELINTADLDTDEIVSSIASDFVERQKYLQLSGKKYSENDELEHLKYQIFRKINKVISQDKIPKILSEINGLHSLIRKVSTPNLVMSDKSKLVTSKIDHDSMFNVIKDWLNSISPKLLNDGNIKNKLNLAKKIANKLENIEKDGSHDYEMQKEILMWLQNILNLDVDKTTDDRAESIHSQPNEFSSTKILEQESSTDVDESILQSILEWIKSTSFHKMATPEEKDLQKNLALFLAANLNKILKDPNIKDDEKNNLLMKEVQKYLKTITSDDKYKNNSYCTKAAADLVDNIKNKLTAENKLPETVTKSNITDGLNENEDLIRQIVTSWCDNLPIHLGHDSKSKEEEEKLKQEIAKQILENSNILNLDASADIPLNVIISDEIDKIFENVPMTRELENSLPVLKSILIDKIVKAKTKPNTENKKELQDTFNETLREIENVSNLNSSSFVLLKDKLVNAFLDLHHDECGDDEFRDQLKDELGDVVHNFCHKYLQRSPSMPLNTEELRRNLSDTMKKALKIRRSDRTKKSPTHSLTQFIPSSSLSPKDKDHLDRIRKRVTSYHQKQSIVIPTRGLCCHLKDIEIQTNLEVRVEDYTQTSKTMLTETGSFNREIFPQVVIKEYYWDSNGSKQSLQTLGPPEVSSPKRMTKTKETRNSQNQTEIKLINKCRKEHISQQCPDANTVRESTSTCGPRCQNTSILPPLRELRDRQQQSENFSQQRRCNRNNSGYFNNNTNERCWWDQPGILEHTKYTGRRRLEDSATLPDDRIVLRRRMCFTSDRSKEHTCCDRNANWRLRPNTCRLPNRCGNKARHCTKCSGGFCPHPTLAFFSKEF